MKMKDLWLNVANEIEANPRCFDFYACTVPEAPSQLGDPDNPPIGCFVGLLARAYGCPKGMSVSLAARIMLTAVGAPEARWSNDSDFYRALNRACILRDAEGWRNSPATAVQAIRWAVEDMDRSYPWLDAELPEPETIDWRFPFRAETEEEEVPVLAGDLAGLTIAVVDLDDDLPSYHEDDGEDDDDDLDDEEDDVD